MWQAIRAWLDRRPIIHSAILTVFVSLLSGAALTAFMVLDGVVGYDPYLCTKSQPNPPFLSVPWHMEGYDCPLQWNDMYSPIIIFSLPFLPLYFVGMATYVAHWYAEARKARREAEGAPADAR